MHLILLFHPRVVSTPSLTEYALDEKNLSGSLNVHRDIKISIGSRDVFSPELFKPGTLYAYVDVISSDPDINRHDPRATMRVKESELYPVLLSLGSQVFELYSKGVLQVIEPVPVDLVIFKARQSRR